VLARHGNGGILQQHDAQLRPEPLKSCANLGNLSDIAAEVDGKQVVNLFFENLLRFLRASLA